MWKGTPGSKRRLQGAVDLPQLGEHLSPPESTKKPRLTTDTSDIDGNLEEGGYCTASGTINPSSSALAVVSSQLVGSGKASCLWSVEEVVEFLQQSGVQESVVVAFKGKYICVVAGFNTVPIGLVLCPCVFHFKELLYDKD